MALLPQKRQFAMLVMPLYFGRNHYGLLLAEAKVPVFHLVFQLGMQLGATFEIINMMEQMEDTKRQLVSANEAKSRFLANMSHEIRTPINAVLGMNEMILRECEDPGILQYAESVRTSGNTLLGLINDILDFSKIEAGKIEILSVDYNLCEVLYDLVNIIKPRVVKKGLSLSLDFDKDLPKQLHGDEVRIKQIIMNILTNAVKYTEKGSISFELGFEKAESEPDYVLLHVSVRDSGIGIRQEDIKKLFLEFERIEEKRNRNIEGTGLGMSITKNLLDSYRKGISDNNAQIEYNRLMLDPDAPETLKTKASMLIGVHIKEPSFNEFFKTYKSYTSFADKMKDAENAEGNFTIEQVMEGGELYKNCWVVWGGRLSGINTGDDGLVRGGSSSTRIFMYPGYTFRTVNQIFTNFHTPQSTLLMLVSAFAGRENILNAYKQAVEERYRFFSYGDCMLIK